MPDESQISGDQIPVNELRKELKNKCRINDYLEVECYILRKVMNAQPLEPISPKRFIQYKSYRKELLIQNLAILNSEWDDLSKVRDQLQKEYWQLNKFPQEIDKFIDECRRDLGIGRNRRFSQATFLKVLNIPESSYFKRKSEPEKQTQREQEMQGRDQAIRSLCSGPKGLRNIWQILNRLHDLGFRASYDKVEKDMMKLGFIPEKRRRNAGDAEVEGEAKMEKDLPLRARVPATWEWSTLSKYYWGTGEVVLGDQEALQGPLLLPSKDRSERRYMPLKYNTLFARFADLPADAESFRQWADCYGSLFSWGEKIGHWPLLVTHEESQHHTDKDGISHICADPAELFKTWHQEHSDIRRATTIWKQWAKARRILGKKNVNDSDKTELQNMISSLERCLVHDGHILCHVDEEDEKENKFFLDPVGSPDELEQSVPILFYSSVWLRKKINQKLYLYPLQASIDWEQGIQVKGLLSPSSLLSAMWYQLLRAVRNTFRGRTRLKKCKICGHWESMNDYHGNWTQHIDGCPKSKVIPPTYIEVEDEAQSAEHQMSPIVLHINPEN